LLLFLIYEAIVRFKNPVEISSELVIWMSILGIAFNGFSAFLLKKDAHHNLNMKSAYIHLLTDMMTSVAVLLGAIVIHYFHWFWIDSAITLFIAIYLIIMGYGILKSTTKILMLFTPENIDINTIVTKIHEVTGNHKLHHIHIWHLNEHELHFEAHLDCNENITIAQFNILVAQIQKVLYHDFHINHCTIQPEYEKNVLKILSYKINFRRY